jgi:hypothetical protein
VSSPGTGTWAALLRYPDDETARPALIAWLAPDASGPPPHIHTDETEYFRSVEGELTLIRDGEPHRLGPGEELTIQPGEAHTFRNDTDGFVAFFSELPSVKNVDAQFTLWGLDHEGAYGTDEEYGEPGLVYGLLVGEALRDEAVFEIAPLAVQRVLWATVGRVAKARGHRAIDEKYLTDEFWEATVEQPEL